MAAALALGCSRIQLAAGTAAPAVLHSAKAAELRCNLAVQESLAQAASWLDMGADCILTEEAPLSGTVSGKH